MIGKLADAIAPVVTAAQEAEHAAAEELAAKVALTSAILALIRPAVRALGTRPRLSESYVAGGRESTTTRAAYRAIPLDSRTSKSIGPSRAQRHHSDTGGEYRGRDLLLTEDGRIVQLSYSGSWSLWDKAQCGWEAAERELSVEDLCRKVDPDDLAENLMSLIGEAGDRGAATKAMLERAVRFRAILTLLAAR